MTTPATPAVLLVPGSWHGPWAYDEVTQRLGTAGVHTVAMELPSNAGTAGLAEDAAAVRAALDDLARPTVVVGHSYGGIAVSEGAARSPYAVALVYLCAFMLAEGESLLDAMAHQLPDWLSVDEGATSHIPVGAEQVLYADCTADRATSATARLTRQSVAAIATPQSAAAWQRLPSSYLVCEQDRAVPPAAQEAMAARAGTVTRVDSSHSPFFSHPDIVADLVLDATGNAVR